MRINLLREQNFEVTNKYIDIISVALKNVLDKRDKVEIREYTNIDDLLKIKKDEFLIVSTVLEGIKLIMAGFTNVIIWYQGIVPEESYMKNKSIVRKMVLSVIEKICIKKCFFRIFVSEEQKKFYEKKYKLKISNNYFIMPCFNSNYNKEHFYIDNKYEDNKFCYIGSTAKWQQFDKIAEIYKKVEERIPNSEFIVLTGNIEEATKIINDLEIKRFQIKHVKPSAVEDEIKKCKYGFILREDCMVNRVATPTKLGNYTASGIIPIFSSCLVSFAEATKELKNFICVDNIDDSVEKIVLHSKEKISVNEIADEYKKIFSKYYNYNYYIEKLEEEFEKIL